MGRLSYPLALHRAVVNVAAGLADVGRGFDTQGEFGLVTIL